MRKDFDDLMTAYRLHKIDAFERMGRVISSRQLRVLGDTLMAEIVYTFTSLSSVDGLLVTRDELAFVFGPEREIVRTNGTVKTEAGGRTRVSWKRDATRLVYEVRERDLPKSFSLAPLYLKFIH